MPMIKEAEILGGTALRRFNIGAREIKPGTKLLAHEVRGIAPANRKALVEIGSLDVHRRSEDDENFMIHRGGAKYDVIQGRKINDEPLSKDDAEELLTQL